MSDNQYNNRWYDKYPAMTQALEIVKRFPHESQRELAALLIQFINLIREKNKDFDADKLSIGKNRTLGLYKSFQRRRWYDRNQALMTAMNSYSTLSHQDCKNISEGILLTIKDSVQTN